MSRIESSATRQCDESTSPSDRVTSGAISLRLTLATVAEMRQSYFGFRIFHRTSRHRILDARYKVLGSLVRNSRHASSRGNNTQFRERAKVSVDPLTHVRSVTTAAEF